METLDALADFKDRYDPVAFAAGVLAFQPDPRQTEILRANPSRCLLNCTRQWGKSTITAIKAVHQAFFHPKSLILVLSPTARQSAEFIAKTIEFLHRMRIKPRGDGKNNISLLFPNGSRIIGLPGKESNIRGFSNVSLLLIDEAARVPCELYRAVRPMLAVSGGSLWLMSTPNGKRGFFYDEWTSGDPSWKRYSIPATECPRIPQAHLEADRKSMPAHFFRQEYLCEFHDADSQFLSSQSIHQAIRSGIPPLQFYPGQYHTHLHSPAPVPPGVAPDRFLSRRFFIGVDLGKTNDFTAFAVLEKSKWLTGPVSPTDFSRNTEIRYEVRHLERLPLGTPYTAVADHCRAIIRHPDIESHCRLVVDATGLGQVFKDLLRERGIAGYVHAVTITAGNSATTTGADSKVPRLHLLNGLSIQFEQGHLRISDQLPLASALASELLSLKVRVNRAGNESIGAWNANQHDDLVFALALAAWQASKERYW